MDISIFINNHKLNCRTTLLLECSGKILIEKNPNLDFSWLPGGRIKLGETSIDAIKREIKEELGYNFKNPKPIALIENFFKYNDEKLIHEYSFVYKETINKDHELYKENLKNLDSTGTSNDYIWVEKEKLKDYNIKPQIIEKIVNEERFNIYYEKDYNVNLKMN